MPINARRPASDLQFHSDAVVVLEYHDSSTVVDRHEFRIGSSPICDLQLSQGPLLHSIIRSEGGVVWIEADEYAELVVNGRICRRMALRDGDVIQACDRELTVRYPLQPSEEETTDVTELSADELCDRILTEQLAVTEFDSARLQGWRDLMAAIQAVAETEDLTDVDPMGSDSDCERLLDQIREMSDMVNGHSEVLDDCESELEAANALLQEAQDRVSQHIEELLEQIVEVHHVPEMRASA